MEPGNGCYSRLQQPAKFKCNHVIGSRWPNDWVCHTTRGHNCPLPIFLHLNGQGLPVTQWLMTAAPGCSEDAISHSASRLHNKLTRVKSRGHSVNAQAPAAHFYPSLVRHVGSGIVLCIGIPLVNNLWERREGRNIKYVVVREWEIATRWEAVLVNHEPLPSLVNEISMTSPKYNNIINVLMIKTLLRQSFHLSVSLFSDVEKKTLVIFKRQVLEGYILYKQFMDNLALLKFVFTILT